MPDKDRLQRGLRDALRPELERQLIYCDRPGHEATVETIAIYNERITTLGAGLIWSGHQEQVDTVVTDMLAYGVSAQFVPIDEDEEPIEAAMTALEGTLQLALNAAFAGFNAGRL